LTVFHVWNGIVDWRRTSNLAALQSYQKTLSGKSYKPFYGVKILRL